MVLYVCIYVYGADRTQPIQYCMRAVMYTLGLVTVSGPNQRILFIQAYCYLKYDISLKVQLRIRRADRSSYRDNFVATDSYPK